MQKKTFDKIKHQFIITLSKLDIEGNFFKFINTLTKKSTTNNIPSGEKLNTFTLDWE